MNAYSVKKAFPRVRVRRVAAEPVDSERALRADMEAKSVNRGEIVRDVLIEHAGRRDGYGLGHGGREHLPKGRKAVIDAPNDVTRAGQIGRAHV